MNTYGPDLGDYPYASDEELEELARAARLKEDKINGITPEDYTNGETAQ